MSQPTSSRVLISFDWALKRLLRNKANYGILEGFLSELLQFEVKVINLLESESNQEAEDDKSNQVDILCENQLKEIILIEVQYFQEIDYFQRMLFGTSKLITEYLHEGAPYLEVRKVYSVNILYFDLGQGKDYVYHGRTVFNGFHHSDELQLSNAQKAKFEKERPDGLYPEYYILKINNFDEHAESSLDEWIYYLKTNQLPNNYSAKGLKEVEEKLKYDQMESAEKKRYNKYIKDSGLSRSAFETALYEGRLKGIEEGMEKGMEKEKRQIVINCFLEGIPTELISKIAGLSVHEVEEIIKEV